MSDNPMGALRKLHDRVRDELKKKGFDLQGFRASITKDSDEVELMFGLDPDFQAPSPHDDELSGILAATAAAEAEAAADKARQGLADLRDQLQHPEDGIL